MYYMFFEDRCSNAGVECYYCQYNPDPCTKDYFDWRDEGEETTQDELEENIN